MTTPERRIDRADFPYASDSDIGELFAETRQWVSAHGDVYLPDDIYGFPVIQGSKEGSVPQLAAVIHSSGPTMYRTRASYATLKNVAPTAIRQLPISDAGLYITYEEAYYDSFNPDKLEYNSPRVRFTTESSYDEQRGVVYDVWLSEGGMQSLYTEFTKAGPLEHDNESELKTYEQAALSDIMRGLGSITVRHRFRRRFLW